MANEIIIPCIGYEEMAEDWELPQSLLGGTKAMRAAGETWLPKEPAEDGYDSRLNRSILYNAYGDTLKKLDNRPFSHPMQVMNLPEELEYLESDVDATGKSLEAFAKEILWDLINFGIAHIFVDHSEHPEVAKGKILTKADEALVGARVLLNVVHPPDLIGWQTEIVDKRTKLTQIRIKETVTEPDGLYGDKDVNYVRLFTEVGWERHKEVVVKQGTNEEKIWKKDTEGEHTFGRIPLITIYANRTGFMMAEPALMDLAWLNLAHWQSYSDQRNILRISRFGILFGSGLPKKMAEAGSLNVGPSKAFLVSEDNAELKYVEHSGKSIESGAKDLEDIEVKMEILGQQPLMRSAPMSTATAKKIDESRNVSQLKSWVVQLEDGIERSLNMSCEWRKIDPPKDMKVDIFKDFEISLYGGTDKELLLKARTEGEITRERWLREEQRRGVFSGDMDPAEEAKLVEDESIGDLKRIVAEEPEDDEDNEDND
jgi:hypothetical protein